MLGRIFGKIKNSFRIMGKSYRLLMMDKELIVLPLIAGIAILGVIATFVFGMGLQSEGTLERLEAEGGSWTLYAGVFALYVVAYTIAFFFQAAVVAGAMERMRGGDPTIRSAMGAASKRFGPIFLWALIAATVGMVIKAIQDNNEGIGRIIAGLFGAAWSLATFFMVPVLVMERQGVGGSFKRSWALIKSTFGETVTAQIAFGLMQMLVLLPIGLLAVALGQVHPVLGISSGVLGVASVMAFFSALQGVFVAALYRFAADDEAPPGFTENEIRTVFA